MMDSLQAVKFLKNFAKKWAKLTACLLLVTACDKLNSPKPVQTTQAEMAHPEVSLPSLKRAIYAAEFQLDPHKIKASSDAAPIRDLLVGLTAFNPKGDVMPAVAQNWFSEDQKEWLFILDEKAKWSNGEPVKAQDFVASWQRLISPENQSLLAKYLIYMDMENAKAIQLKEKTVSDLGVSALNDTTLKIRLNHPNSLLPEMLAHSALLPTYQGVAPTAEDFVSNGAYQIEKLEPQKIVLKAREPEPFFQQVEYELITANQDYRVFDIVENPQASQKEHISQFPRLCAYYYEFNFAHPQLKKQTVREALRTMVTSSNLGQSYGIPSQSVIPHHLAKDREKQWTPVIVEQLLSKAGISQTEPLKLTLLYDESELNTDIANQMIRTLSQSELFNITPKTVDWNTLNALREKKEYDLSRAGWCADYRDPVVFLQKFHSQSPDNHSGYKNELVDKKLERLQQEVLEKEERNQIIEEISQTLYDDVAVLPLFQYQHRVGIVSSLLGIDLNNDSEVIYSKDLKRILTNKDQPK